MLVHLGALALTILVVSQVVPDVRVSGIGSAIAVAIVFSLLNYFFGWVVRALLFVPALLTLGLLFFFMTFIVNAVMLWATDKLMASFEITSSRGLFLAAAAITAVNWFFYRPWLWHAGRLYGGPPRWV